MVWLEVENHQGWGGVNPPGNLVVRNPHLHKELGDGGAGAILCREGGSTFLEPSPWWFLKQGTIQGGIKGEEPLRYDSGWLVRKGL